MPNISRDTPSKVQEVSLKNLLSGGNKQWINTPTKAIRVPEILADKLLEIARKLDNGEPIEEKREFPPLESLSLKQLIQISRKIPALINQKRLESYNRCIEECSIYLSDKCDGASKEDGQGFNKIDAPFGNWVAKRIKAGEQLTRAIAESVHKMLTKYLKTQLEPAGYTLTDWEELESQYPQSIKDDSKGKEYKLLLEADSICLYSPYDRELINKIKDADFFKSPPIAEYQDKRFKCWKYKPSEAKRLVKRFKDFYIDPLIEALILEQERQGKIEERLKVENAEAQAKELMELLAIAKLDKPLECGWNLFNHQREAVEWLLVRRSGGIYSGGILADQMGLGKAQPLDAKILTPTGWKLMGDMEVGDPVINSSGGSSYVTGVFPQGVKKIYKVIFTDGSSTECCEDHLWAVQTPWMKQYQGKFKVRELKEIKNSLAYSNGNLKHYVPIVKPIEFEERDIPIDPYLLGCLIGDGGLSRNAAYFSTSDSFLLEELSKRLPNGIEIAQQKGEQYNYRLTRGKSPKMAHPLLEDLREIGLSGKNAYDKFIPDCYKFSSVKTRVELFQGLMDTDGSICNGVLEFFSSSYQLAKDVQFLVQSLGGRCTFNSRKPWYSYRGVKKQGATSHRLVISLPPGIYPFKLPRKADCYKPRAKYLPSRAIKEVLYVGEKEAQCIAVSALNSLYVTDDCIVTHNTISALVAAKALNERRPESVIFVICPASLRENWAREASKVGAKIETYSYAKMPKPLESTPYILIADEAHYCQNISAQRTKNLVNLCQDKNCLASWLLTGTPIKNGRPINLFPLLVAINHPLGKNKREYEEYYCNAHYKQVTKGKSVWDNNGAAHLAELSKKTEDYILRRTKEDCLDLPPKIRIMKPVDLTLAKRKAYHLEVSRLIQDYRNRASQGLVNPDSEALVTINILRKIGSKYKVDAAIQETLDWLEEGQQVVIFTEFLESVNLLYKELSKQTKVEILTGETKQDKRQAIVDNFQSGKTKVFIGTIKAGGVGLTLTASSFVILVDRGWTPGDAYQAEDRTHRIGAKNTVTSTWLQLGEIDRTIDELLQSKQENIELVLKGKRKTIDTSSLQGMARQLLEML